MLSKSRCRFLNCTVAIALATASLVSMPARPETTADTVSDGKIFSGTGITHTTAQVFAIAPGSNSVTLLDENGKLVDVVVDKELGDVNKLQIGDKVSVTYSHALLLRADKTVSSAIRERIDTQTTTPFSAGSATSVHKVEAIATVESLDRARQQLTLRGPTRTVTLQASSESILDGLRVGDTVHVDYVEATAVQITRNGASLQ